MITKEQIEVEMRTGLSFVCSACEHWHEARDRGLDVACNKKCGGPMSGKGFPEYKGPYASSLSEYCFICGKKADASFNIENRLLGVCKTKGPSGTCLDVLKQILQRSNIVVKEVIVPKLGGEGTCL